MLEDLAIQYVSQTEGSLRAIGYGLVILGAIIAGATSKSKSEIARAPYLAYSAFLVLAASVMQIVWLQSLPAMAGGYLWTLLAVDVVTRIVVGFFFGQIAMARSRDAYGHGRLAALAFIPFANFWLLLTPSKNAVSANRVPTISLLTGGVGVLSGFVVMFTAFALNAFIEEEIIRRVERAQTEPASQQTGIEHMIRSEGLEATLRAMTADSQTPITVDEITMLTRVEADGTQLRRTFVVDLESFSITDEFRTDIENNICAYGPFISLLRAGATIREIYVKPDGAPIGAHIVTPDVCGL